MYDLIKLEYEASIYDGFGFGTNFKRFIKSVVQINQSSNIKSSVVQQACNGIQSGDQTRLVLYAQEKVFFVNYRDCGKLKNLYQTKTCLQLSGLTYGILPQVLVMKQI